MSMGQLVLSLGRKFYNLLAGEEAASNTNVFYNPADLTSLRVNTDGSGGQPVVGDPVGIMLDTSPTGSQTMAVFIAGQPELVTNGTFDTDTSGWTASTGFTVSSDNGGLKAAYDGSTGQFYVGAAQAVTTEIGKLYEITFDVTALNNNTGRLRVEVNLGDGKHLNKGTLGLGSYTYKFYASTTTTYLNFSVQTNSAGSATYDNISVKELPGHHAIAPADSARPVLYDEFDQTAAALTDNGTRTEMSAEYHAQAGTLPTGLAEGEYIIRRSSDSSQQWWYKSNESSQGENLGRTYEITYTVSDDSTEAGSDGLLETEAGRVSINTTVGTYTITAVSNNKELRFLARVGHSYKISNVSYKRVNTVFDGQPNLVTNGTFDTDSDWTKGAGWSIGSGVASASSATGNLQQTGVATANKWYKIQFYISAYTSGTITPNIGGTSGASYNSTGWKSEIFRANGTPVNFLTSSFTGSIDNVSVQEVPASIPRSYYLDTDGVDDWMEVKPTLNLGEQWWHVGAWQSDTDGKYVFATTASFKGALRHAASVWKWRNAADTGQETLINFDPTTLHVLTVEQAGTNSISGRANGANSAGVIAPYDDSGDAQGLALFSQENDNFNKGLDGRFYGGSWGQEALDSDQREITEAYIASLAGITLP